MWKGTPILGALTQTMVGNVPEPNRPVPYSLLFDYNVSFQEVEQRLKSTRAQAVFTEFLTRNHMIVCNTTIRIASGLADRHRPCCKNRFVDWRCWFVISAYSKHDKTAKTSDDNSIKVSNSSSSCLCASRGEPLLLRGQFTKTPWRHFQVSLS